MLSIKDCLDYCDLLEDHVTLLAEYKGIPKQLAAHIACSLVQTPEGIELFSNYMLCVIQELRAQGADAKADEAEELHASFIATHPLSPP